jgi:hypothetical protein
MGIVTYFLVALIVTVQNHYNLAKRESEKMDQPGSDEMIDLEDAVQAKEALPLSQMTVRYLQSGSILPSFQGTIKNVGR